MPRVQRLPRDPAHVSKLLELLAFVDWDLLVRHHLEVRVGAARCRVVRFRDLVRHGPQAFERVGEGAHRAREGARWLVLLLDAWLFMRHFVELPESSEALLATEVGRLEAQLDAGRALHGGRLRAVGGRAGALGRLGGHLVRLLLLLGFDHCI